MTPSNLFRNYPSKADVESYYHEIFLEVFDIPNVDYPIIDNLKCLRVKLSDNQKKLP